jgi:hypothetical protein
VEVRDAHLVSHGLNPRDPDATHLPANTVPAGGGVMDEVSDDHEPRFKPDEPQQSPQDARRGGG